MNIFVTVGTQLPFDRLIRAMDVWTHAEPFTRTFGQTGHGSYQPCHMEHADTLSRQEFLARVEWADAIVSHAGVGSILTAVERKKPIIVFPRRHEFGEHRTDHQRATAEHLSHRNFVNVAYAEHELFSLLLHPEKLIHGESAGIKASPGLIQFVQDFVLERSA